MATVRLHLLRHAHAGDPDRWTGSDAARPLSAKGRDQARRMAAFLEASGATIDAVVTSPKVRARETAEPVAEAFGIVLHEDPRLAGALSASELEAVVADAGDPSGIVVVGHDPDFSDLLGDLTGLARATMRKGALARIDLERPIAAGGGVLRWLVPPDALPD